MQKTFSEKEVPQIANEICQILSKKGNNGGATILALSGDLGAGKTTLTQAIARELGITERLISPTFVIMKLYTLPVKSTQHTTLVHIDAYRLDSDDELLKLGWDELIGNPNNLVIIEWPERVAGVIPERSIKVGLEHIGNVERKIKVK